MVNKIAVVTGAGTGIGRAVAVTLLKAGYRVALAGRRQEPLDETADLGGGEALAVATDVADPASVAALFEAVRAKWGRLDLLFNNAGLNAPGVPFDELPIEKWTEIVAVNLTGSFLCAQQAFRMMKSQEPNLLERWEPATSALSGRPGNRTELPQKLPESPSRSSIKTSFHLV